MPNALTLQEVLSFNDLLKRGLELHPTHDLFKNDYKQHQTFIQDLALFITKNY
jgi:negative regulator of genetic competence, sporulation and motility